VEKTTFSIVLLVICSFTFTSAFMQCSVTIPYETESLAQKSACKITIKDQAHSASQHQQQWILWHVLSTVPTLITFRTTCVSLVHGLLLLVSSQPYRGINTSFLYLTHTVRIFWTTVCCCF